MRSDRGRRAALLPVVFALLSAIAAGCARTPAPGPGASSSLRLNFRTAPRDAASPVLGPVDTIHIAVDLGFGYFIDTLPIARGQTRFEVSVDVPIAGPIAVRAAAIGARPIAGGPVQTLTGRGALYVASETGIRIEPGEVAAVELEFTPFVPEFHAPLLERDGTTHRVSWTRLDGAIYQLSRRAGGVVLPDTLVSDTTYTGRAVPAEYQVRAIGSVLQTGAPSDIQVITGGPPPVPTGFLAVAGFEDIVLNWDPPTTPVESFDIERSVEGDDFQAFTTRDGDVVEAIDTGVQDGLQYSYRIRSRRGAQVSPFSAPRTALVPLRPPADLRAEGGRAAVTLLWTDQSASESGYEVERRAGTTSPFQPLATLAPNSKEFVDPQPPAGVPLQYRVRAIRGARVSEWAGPVQIQL